MDDLISRQAAIDALGEEPEVWTDDDDYALGQRNQWRYDVTALKAVQSAQPDLDEWCKDCKEYDKDRHCCPRFNRAIRKAMSETFPQGHENDMVWIPCSERLPEYDAPALLSTAWGKTEIGWWTQRGWVIVPASYRELKQDAVVAWMPLPEPYRAARGETDGEA